MIVVNLDPIPNQTVSMRLDDRLYTITVKETRGVMSVDISRDGEQLVQGLRVVSGTPLLPYRYLENGNFVLFTENEQYPDYTQFGSTQRLEYVTLAELEALRDE